MFNKDAVLRLLNGYIYITMSGCEFLRNSPGKKNIVIQSTFVIIVKVMCLDCKIAYFKIFILDFSEDLYACSTILTAIFCR